MSANTASQVLVVGGSPPWGEHAVNALVHEGIEARWVPIIGDAVALVKTDISITTVVLAENGDKNALLAAMTRMAIARPELFMVVLAAGHDLDRMERYLQLGQRTAGPLRVRYLQNDYNYQRLPGLIREVAGQADQEVAAHEADVPAYAMATGMDPARF